MDRLKLHVNKTRFDEQRQTVALVRKKCLQTSHALHNTIGGRRHKESISRTRPAAPVLGPPKFARLFVASPSLREKNPVDLANESEGKRKALTHALHSMREGCDIIRNLLNVLHRNTRGLIVLEQKQV